MLDSKVRLDKVLFNLIARFCYSVDELGITIFYPQFGGFCPDMGMVVLATVFLDTAFSLNSFSELSTEL